MRVIDNPNWQQFAASLEDDRKLPRGFLAAIAKNETDGGHEKFVKATSSAGAKGMFQFMDATAKQYNVNVHDTADSTRGAADYLSDLMHRYGDPHLAAAAYNWGQGNLDKAIAKAKAAGVGTSAQELAQAGFLPKETAGYVQKLDVEQKKTSGPQPFTPEVIEQTRNSVREGMIKGMPTSTIIGSLKDSPVGTMIADLKASGLDDETIVRQIIGKDADTIQNTRAQGFGANLADGASAAVDDVVGGAKQLSARITGDDTRLKELQQQEIDRQNDVKNRVVSDSAGGVIGNIGTKAVPYIGAAALTGGTSIPALAAGQAATGAAMGALTPTTQDGQFASNIAGEAALGGASAVGGALVGRVAGAGLKAGGNRLIRGASELGPEEAHSAFARKVGERVGVAGADKIDSSLVQAADDAIRPAFNAAEKAGVKVTVPKGFQQAIADVAESLDTPRKSVANLMKAVTGADSAGDAALLKPGLEITGDKWIALRKALAEDLRSVDGSDKVRLGELIGKVDDAVVNHSNLDAKALESLSTARDRYKNLQVVESMLYKSGGDPTKLTAAQIKQAIKSNAGDDAFARGRGALQDLIPDAEKIVNPSSFSKMINGYGDILSPATYAGFALGGADGGVATILGRKLVAAGLKTEAGRKAVQSVGKTLVSAGEKTAKNRLGNAAVAELLVKTGKARRNDK